MSVFWHDTPAEEAPPPEYVRCILCGAVIEIEWMQFHSDEECDVIGFESV